MDISALPNNNHPEKFLQLDVGMLPATHGMFQVGAVMSSHRHWQNRVYSQVWPTLSKCSSLCVLFLPFHVNNCFWLLQCYSTWQINSNTLCMMCMNNLLRDDDHGLELCGDSDLKEENRAVQHSVSINHQIHTAGVRWNIWSRQKEGHLHSLINK